MSTKNINKSNLRKYNITSNKKQNKTKKAFNYSKNKSYSEETESSPSKNKKENTFDDVEFNFQKNNYDSEIVYEDEYQGLIYHPVYPDMAVFVIHIHLPPGRLEFRCRHQVRGRIVQFLVDFNGKLLENFIKFVFRIKGRYLDLLPDRTEHGHKQLLQVAPFRNSNVGLACFQGLNQDPIVLIFRPSLEHFFRRR